MKSTEIINSVFKSELTARSNPFLNFTQKIKQFSNQNFIVDWQIDKAEKKELLNEQAYHGMIL